MTKPALGPVGVTSQEVSHGDRAAALDAAAEVEDLGYAALWLNDLDRIVEVVRATARLPVGGGIIAVHAVAADELARTYADVEGTHPGRFVVGLGGAHDAHPLATLNAYFDRLDTVEPKVPVEARVLAALGPRMLRLARERASGALPVFITPDYTATARQVLGDDTGLLVQQFVVDESEPDRARAMVRGGPLGFLSQLPAYGASFRRMGFTDDDISGMSDRLVDGLVAWGDLDTIVQRVADHRQAGADHVALSMIGDPAAGPPLATWRRLADALL
jgi:probable F420-dependent oxidoreductase